jgi:integrase
VLEPLWTKNTETASRVRSRIESILDWAKVRGFRDGDNPARWQGHLDNLLPTKSSVAKVKHHPAMPYAELPAFMTTLRAAATPAARALEFTILTASRSGEVLGADWSEIDLAAKTWTVPAARMKEKRAHSVPLSDAAITALGTPGTGLVFNARPGHPLNKNAFMELLRRAGHGVTAHGFRSTFRDWAAEQTDFAFEVVEMSLAHKVGNEVSRAYFRSDLFDRRRFLMDAWAAFCSGVGQADNVMTLRRA